MKRFLGVILVIIFFIACGESRPKGIFSEEKMTDFLFDFHLAEGLIITTPSDSLQNEKINYYSSVYEKYDTDSAQAMQNLEYYAEHPQELQDVYAEVSKRLQNAEKELKKIEEERLTAIFKLDSVMRQRATDSLNLLNRDSLLNFNGQYDLFLHPTDSALTDSLSKVDSLRNRIVIDPLIISINNEQKRWEMIFYYFDKSNPSSVLIPFSTEKKKSPAIDPKKQGKALVKDN